MPSYTFTQTTYQTYGLQVSKLGKNNTHQTHYEHYFVMGNAENIEYGTMDTKQQRNQWKTQFLSIVIKIYSFIEQLL